MRKLLVKASHGIITYDSPQRRLMGIITKKDMLRHVAEVEHQDPNAIQYH